MYICTCHICTVMEADIHMFFFSGYDVVLCVAFPSPVVFCTVYCVLPYLMNVYFPCHPASLSFFTPTTLIHLKLSMSVFAC